MHCTGSSCCWRMSWQKTARCTACCTARARMVMKGAAAAKLSQSHHPPNAKMTCIAPASLPLMLSSIFLLLLNPAFTAQVAGLARAPRDPGGCRQGPAPHARLRRAAPRHLHLQRRPAIWDGAEASGLWPVGGGAAATGRIGPADADREPRARQRRSRGHARLHGPSSRPLARSVPRVLGRLLLRCSHSRGA